MIIHDCEQGSAEWHALRAGKPTSSEFSRLITSTGVESKGIDEYSIDLALELFNGEANMDFGGNKFTRRGKELEPEACADYEMENQVHAQHVGFVTDNLQRYGCSPDALIGKDSGLEIKCMSDKVHYKMLKKYDIDGQTPAEYVAQPQGCLFITKRKHWDLFLYHPKMRSITIRQYPDLLYFKTLRKQLRIIESKRNEAIKYMNESV